jgi:hypothetical protein
VKLGRKCIFATLVVFTLHLAAPGWAAGGFQDGHREALGPFLDRAPHNRDGVKDRLKRRGADAKAQLLQWNEIAIDASGLDHTPGVPGSGRIFGEQLGPGRSSRAMAIVHIAMFDAVNAITGGYQSYTGLAAAPHGTSMDAAIAVAAHDTLVALFPSQRASFDKLLVEDLNLIEGDSAKTRGIDLGRQAAAAILALRANDGAQHAEPRVGVDYIT